MAHIESSTPETGTLVLDALQNADLAEHRIVILTNSHSHGRIHDRAKVSVYAR